MSQYLLDTHTFIWLSENSDQLSSNLKDIIEEADTVYLSIVSLWEIAIKLNLGKLSLNKIMKLLKQNLKPQIFYCFPSHLTTPSKSAIFHYTTAIHLTEC